jgi:O-antigen/teichoic acid export membrane protein
MSSSALQRFGRRAVARARDVAATMSAEIVSLVSLAIIFPITARGLGVEGYGQYTVLYLIYGLAGLWVHAAPSAAAVQLVLQLGTDSERLLTLGQRRLLLVAAPVALLGTAIAVGLLGWPVLVPALLVFGVDFALASVSSINLGVVLAVDGIPRTTRIRLIQPVLKALGTVVLALTGTVSLLTLVCLNVAVSGVLLLRSIVAVRRRSRNAEGTRQPTGKEFLRYTTYYATSMSTNVAQNEGEKFVLATTRPAAEVGQYAAAYRLVSLTLIPVSAVMGAANRWFMVRDDQRGAHLSRAARIAVPTAIYGIIAGIAVLIGRDLVEVVAGSGFDDAATIAAWLCLLPLLHGLAELPPAGLLGLGRNRERMLMGFATSVLAVVSYLVLVPPFGWRGAVIGTYVSEAAAILVGWVLLARYQRLADRRTTVGVSLAASSI